MPAVVLHDSHGRRVVAAASELMRSLRFVFERERADSWAPIMKSMGRACGKALGVDEDAALAAAGRPALAAQSLEASLAVLQSKFTEYGWGVLAVDVSGAADFGLIIGRLEHSWFATSFADGTFFTDPFPAGVILGYFEHITGQVLDGAELACAGRGAPHCIFAVTTPDRLALIAGAITHESAEQLIARLKA